jgi:thiamine kinase-like enzyme
LDVSQAASNSSIDRSQHENVLKTRLQQLQQQLFEEARRLLVDNDQQVQQRYETVLQQQQVLADDSQRAQAQRIAQLEAELRVHRTHHQQRSSTKQHVVVQLIEQSQSAVRQLRLQQRGVQRAQQELGSKARLIMHAGMNQVDSASFARLLST